MTSRHGSTALKQNGRSCGQAHDADKINPSASFIIKCFEITKFQNIKNFYQISSVVFPIIYRSFLFPYVLAVLAQILCIPNTSTFILRKKHVEQVLLDIL